MTTLGDNDFVTLIASLEGDEPVRRRVRKDVIQTECRFLKEYIDDGVTEIKIPLIQPKNLDLILKFIHAVQLIVSKENPFESLWNDARILGLVNLQKVCIQRLTETIGLDSWIQRLEFARAEGCHDLESSVLSFVNANFEDCCRCSTFISLNVDQMVQGLQLPTVQTTVTESSRIALILEWIKVNEADRRPQAHRLLEQVDLMNLTKSSLCSFLNKESAFRNWRCGAIFERGIRLKRLEETARHSDAVRAPLHQFELPEAQSEMLEGTRTIKQEMASEEPCDAEDVEVNESQEDVTTNSAGESTSWMKQEFSLSSTSSVWNTMDFFEGNADDPSTAKMPRLEYSQADPVAMYQPRLSSQKQILYLRKNSQHGYSLNFVILSADSVSLAERVQVNLPYYNNHIPKLIWSEEARGLFFLGGVNNDHRVLSTVHYMNRQRPLNVTDGPYMSCTRHRFQPAILNGGLYAIGGSKWVGLKNKTRLSKAEVLDMTAPKSEWQWRPIDSTPMKCDLFTAAVAGGRIYIIGGLRDSPNRSRRKPAVVMNEVMCYELTSNKWDFVSSMGFPRCGHASCVVGHSIYALGGCNLNYSNPQEDLPNMSTAEVYDIEENQWTVIAPMQRPRFGGSAVEMEGKIYVFGGDYDSHGKIPASVECYNPVSDSWTYVSTSVESQGFFDSIAVIDNPEYFL